MFSSSCSTLCFVEAAEDLKWASGSPSEFVRMALLKSRAKSNRSSVAKLEKCIFIKDKVLDLQSLDVQRYAVHQ